MSKRGGEFRFNLAVEPSLKGRFCFHAFFIKKFYHTVNDRKQKYQRIILLSGTVYVFFKLERDFLLYGECNEIDKSMLQL